MTFTEAAALFTVHSYNCKILHWGACGERFDDIHMLSEEYSNMLRGTQDVIMEMGLRNGETPAKFSSIGKAIKDDYILEYTEFEYDDFCEKITDILENVLEILHELYENELYNKPINIGIRSTIESIFDSYDMQLRYIHARRSK